MTDEELLRAWKAGDKKAGDTLIRRHHDRVHRFFRNKVAEPKDLVQRTFLACLEHIDRFRGEASFLTFLLSIAKRVLYKHLRTLAGPRGRVDMGVDSVEDLQQSPSEVLAKTNQERLLLRAMRSLSVERQVLLELHYWDGLKVAELAQVVELPVGTVKTRMSAARKRLKQFIKELAEEPGLVQSTLSLLSSDDSDDGE